MKYLQVLLVAVLISTTSFARDNKSRKSDSNFSCGVKIGLSYPNLHYKNITDDPAYTIEQHRDMEDLYLSLPTMGIYARIKINDFLSFQPELLYEDYYNSWLHVETDDLTGYHSCVELYNNIHLPLLANVRLGNTFFITGGIQLSYHLDIVEFYSYYDKNGSAGSFVTNDPKTGIEVDYNKFDIAPVLGLEYEFNFGLNIGLKGSWGLINIYKEPVNNEKILIHNYQFFVGYSILR